VAREFLKNFKGGIIMKEVEYTVVGEYEILTKDTYNYGLAPTAGRDDRIAYIIEIDELDIYIVYTEGYYHYSCTKNLDGVNRIYIPGDASYIEIPSETVDFRYDFFKSYEEAVDYIYSFEDTDYYVVR